MWRLALRRLERSGRPVVGASDLVRMDADKWHKARDFRPKLVRDDAGHAISCNREFRRDSLCTYWERMSFDRTGLGAYGWWCL